MYGTKIVVINVKIPYGTKWSMLKMSSWYEMVIWLAVPEMDGLPVAKCD
jgi:hypothetical protein